MDKRSLRRNLVKELRSRFSEAGREDVLPMSDARFYRYILAGERRNRENGFTEKRARPVDYCASLILSINRYNAQRAAYALSRR